MMPGGFNDPSEDCNCRCALLQRAKWALDEGKLNVLKERAEYFELDKAKDFDDFRKKYLEISKTEIEKNGKNGTIKASKSSMAKSRKFSNPIERAKIINEAIRADKPFYAEDLRKAYITYGVKQFEN